MGSSRRSSPDWTFTPSDAQKRRYDPEQAKKLLDEAGYRAGPDGKRAGPDGKPLALRLVVATDTATNRQTSEYLVGWFASIGVTLTPEFKSSNQADDDQIAGNFDLAFSGWSVNPDPDTTLAQQTCAYNGTDNSDSGYCNPAYDALYLQQQVEIDPPKRQEIVRQMQSMLYDDVAAIHLTNDKLLEAYRNDRFGGFVDPAGGRRCDHRPDRLLGLLQRRAGGLHTGGGRRRSCRDVSARRRGGGGDRARRVLRPPVPQAHRGRSGVTDLAPTANAVDLVAPKRGGRSGWVFAALTVLRGAAQPGADRGAGVLPVPGAARRSGAGDDPRPAGGSRVAGAAARGVRTRSSAVGAVRRSHR